ncbi:MFS transporter [Rhodobacteraceae bacterium NNCM2]|nr:MFS transporter [Coraliihabitans acroporae]
MSNHPPNQFALLRTRRYLPLFLVLFLGALNDQVFKNAFVALVTFVIATQSGMVPFMGLDIGLDTFSLVANILFILPFALVAPTAGQITDQLDKAVMIRFVKISEIVIMSMAVLCYIYQQVELLLLVLFLMGAQSAIFGPVKYAVLPQYLTKEELLGGNGLAQAATFLAIIFGTIMGTQIILIPDVGTVAVSVSVMVIAVAGYIAARYTPSAPPLGGKTKVDWVLPRAAWNLVVSCRSRGAAFAAILLIAWFWFVGVAFMSLLGAYTKTVLQADANVLTALLTCFSIGVAIGALLANRIAMGGSGLAETPWAALALGTIAVALWVVTPHGAPGAHIGIGEFLSSGRGVGVFLCFIGLAIAGGIYITPLNTLLQRAAPGRQRAQFVACSNVVDSVAMVLSGICGLVLGLFGLVSVDIFAVFGLTAIPIAVCCARLTPGHRLRLAW